MKRQVVPALREREGRDHILKIGGTQPELEEGIGGQGRAQGTNEKAELPDQQVYNGPRVPGRKLTTTPDVFLQLPTSYIMACIGDDSVCTTMQTQKCAFTQAFPRVGCVNCLDLKKGIAFIWNLDGT